MLAKPAKCLADVVGKIVGQLGGGLQRHPGLARAAGTRERDEAHARRSHQRAEIAELAAAADESGRLQGRFVGRLPRVRGGANSCGSPSAQSW
jgi:hypothetical protein